MFKIGERPNVSYHCPMCETIYKTHAEANECISSHVVPLIIDCFCDVDVNGPETITVLFSNGTKGRYELAQVIESDT